MIGAHALLDELAARGVVELTGVPCSYLTPLINRVASDPAVRYVPATHEGEALALAAGAWLAGATTCVISQNSGLGNMVNPLTSLTHPCRIPVPLIVTWRGEPGLADEPQHELLGAVTPDLLSLMGVGHAVLPSDGDRLGAALDAGWAAMRRDDLPYAFVLRRGTVEPTALSEPEPAVPVRPDVVRCGEPDSAAPRRVDSVECLLGTIPDTAAVISTTGKTSRELFTLADRPQHFYLVGAMGSASAVGLGVARHSSRPVVVVDGDGAALMRLGTLATIGAHAAPGLVHVLLDNQVHDSTGGQRSLSAQVDFPGLASACGYRQVYECRGLSGFAEALKSAQARPGPSFVHLRVQPGSLPDLGRPTVPPSEVARRFREFLSGRT
ncbi:phosphonopyruvate decarboxylase [Umezawaea endophytica]|uniref:Phosphonopyruvate decarboxylase n=1 Tax=Umezawaea endophytica TaxID=1654476 RepID=A0A9X3AH11_9PSEU|nr:phosphonopyruvate decarboxylase [Umezawaea endophytica]MCS7480346.1 phosphonopyruvate decarboxylase [Umezawaea endophytica]